jgi:WhiB family transcriptional regulator, redox-sensing transcriptional regulator
MRNTKKSTTEGTGELMYTATAPPSGAFLELGGGVAELLDATPLTGPDLACQVNDPDLWFAESPADLERAKALCANCPVRAQCLAGALARHEPWGVWGGEIFERGLVIPRKRPRGRPRKDDRRHEPVPSARTDKAAQETAA